MSGVYRFSFGPWNIHEGAEPFGPPVRERVPAAEKFRKLKPLRMRRRPIPRRRWRAGNGIARRRRHPQTRG